MAVTASTIFTGTSTYSADFQNAITRAVAIASLPITQLTSDKTALTNQSTQLTTLDTTFSALQTAVQGIDQALSGSSFTADISNPAVVGAVIGNGAAEGNYSVQVVDAGAYATSLSTSSWVNTPGAPQTYQLFIGAQEHDIVAADNSAASIASAINSQYGAQVGATVVNVGSTGTPDYRISLQGVALGPTPVDIKLSGTSLQTPQVVGRVAQYIVNGSGLTVNSTSRSVTIATGLTVNLLSSNATPANITITRPTTPLSNALAAFTSAYNAAVTGVGGQVGQSGGLLQGQSVILSASQALGSIATYNSPGASISVLSSLGLDLGVDGKLTYTPTTLLGADLISSASVTAFLGSASGGGFLKVATDALTGLEDPTIGSIKTSEAAMQTQITSIGNNIATKQSAVDQLQKQLETQMTSADALIASLQQQFSYLTSLFQAEQSAALQFK